MLLLLRKGRLCPPLPQASPLTFCQTSGVAASDPGCANRLGAAAPSTLAAPASLPRSLPLAYRGTLHTIGAIWSEEGWRGFCRGVRLRMLIHAPSVAICWTTYEGVKHALQRLDYF